MTVHASELLAAVEQELHDRIQSMDDTLAPLYNMMGYHLGWLDASLSPVQANPGKRTRPLLCLLCCLAAGGEWRRAVPAAAALELVHNFSLLHDDIEDNSETRRGRSTVWKLWGLAQGINTGDAMHVLAHRSVAGLQDQGYGPQVVVEVYGLLDDTLSQLCEGQYLDMAFEGDLGVTEHQYMRMIGGKTAALFAASTQLGAYLAGSPDHSTHFRQFGWSLGLAFQMVDDVLGIWGDPQVTGKSAASDLCDRKMTLPVIHALQHRDTAAGFAELYRGAALGVAELPKALALLANAGARKYVEGRVDQFQAAARLALNAVHPPPAYGRMLQDLVDSVGNRNR